REAVALAASGQVRPIVTERLPLAHVGDALAALQAGRVIGRAVLLPNGALPPSTAAPSQQDTGLIVAQLTAPSRHGQDVPAATEPAPSAGPAAGTPRATPATESAAAREQEGRDNGRPADSDEVPLAPPAPAARRDSAARGNTVAPSRRAAPSGAEIEAELVELIGRGVDGPRDDAEFEDLSLRLFAYQFANNTPYRQYCERQGRTPENVTRWQDVPFVPIAAFKEAVLACEPPEQAAACFQSSGTTGTKRSQHFHPSLAVYDLSASTNWRAHLLPE